MRKKKHCHVKVSFTQVSLGLQAHLFLNTDFLEHEKQAENVQECHRNAAIMKERTFCELSLKHHQRVECRVDSSLILTMQCHILKLPQSSDKSQLFNYKRLTCCSYTKKKKNIYVWHLKISPASSVIKPWCAINRFQIAAHKHVNKT